MLYDILNKSIMPKLKVIGSNSSGNGYILECDNDTLLIECGMPFNDANYNIENINNVVGALCSHTHQDHAKYIKQYQKYGIRVYSCQEVCDKYDGVRLLPLKHKTKIGKFVIQPILVEHNVECYSFLIQYEDFRLLFCTDLNSFPHKIRDLNCIMIESNYDDEIILDNGIDNNSWSQSASENHLSIDQTIGILKENYSPSLNQIVLLHLSNGNSNAKQFKERVQFELGFDNVYVAEKEMNIELLKDLF